MFVFDNNIQISKLKTVIIQNQISSFDFYNWTVVEFWPRLPLTLSSTNITQILLKIKYHSNITQNQILLKIKYLLLTFTIGWWLGFDPDFLWHFHLLPRLTCSGQKHMSRKYGTYFGQKFGTKIKWMEHNLDMWDTIYVVLMRNLSIMKLTAWTDLFLT